MNMQGDEITTRSSDELNAELELCAKVMSEIIEVLGIESSELSDDQGQLVQQIILRELSQARGPGHGLRGGRPEHLTLQVAEEHADWLRGMGTDNVRVVGKLLVVAVDEVRRLRAREASLLQDLDRGAKISGDEIDRLRAQNTVLQSAREGVRELVQRHEEYQALAEQLVSIIEHPNTITAEALLRDCMNAARALRHFNWSIPAPAPKEVEDVE